ncbi:MAG: hypothetical protein AAF841_06155 [Pseudomonadota bacterium]
MIVINGRRLTLKTFPGPKLRQMVKRDPKTLKQTFFDIDVYACKTPDKKPNLPDEITLEPLIAFWSFGADGKPDPKGAREQADALKTSLGVKSYKAIDALFLKALGKAKSKVPKAKILGQIDEDAKEVIGYWRVYRYYSGQAQGRARFILGLPLALGWGLYRVGMCGKYVSEEMIKTDEGMKRVFYRSPQFVRGPYETFTSAEYRNVPANGIGAPVISANALWKRLAKQEAAAPLGPNQPRHPPASQPSQGPSQAAARPIAKEGVRILGTYG